ncbi:hypothetical protein D3C76_1848660 [compost metagenome]
MTRRHSAGDRSAVRARAPEMPALLNSTSTRPKAFMALSTMAWQAASSATLVGTTRAWPAISSRVS